MGRQEGGHPTEATFINQHAALRRQLLPAGKMSMGRHVNDQTAVCVCVCVCVCMCVHEFANFVCFGSEDVLAFGSNAHHHGEVEK